MRANTDFKEEIKRITPTEDKQGSVVFPVYNDGVVVDICVPTLNGEATGAIYAEYPSDMSPSLLGVFEANGNDYRRAFLCSGTLKIDYSISAGSDVFICVKSISASAVIVNTAYNFVGPKTGKIFVITGLTLYANQRVSNTADATVVVYEADSPTTTTSSSDIFNTNMVRGNRIVLNGLFLQVTEGKWVNLKTTDNDVYGTIIGYYTDA